jgi:hypothetical protein
MLSEYVRGIGLAPHVHVDTKNLSLSLRGASLRVGRAGGDVMRTTIWRSRSLLERYAASAAGHAGAAPRSSSPADRL